MKQKIREIWKKYGGLAVCILLVGIMVFALWCVSTYTEKRDNVTASADSVDSVETVAENTDNSTLYPSANLIPYPYLFNTFTSNGITYTSQNDGSVKVKGTATALSICDLGKTSCYFNIGSSLGKPSTAGGFTVSGGKDLVTVAVNAPNGMAYLYVIAGRIVDTVIYPMLNIGEVAYPYIPNLEGLQEEAYKQGELKAKAGYFADVCVQTEPTLINGGSLIVVDNTTPTYVYGGVSFGYLYDLYKPYATDYGISKIRMNLFFDMVVPASSLRMKATGNETAFVNTFYVVADDGVAYPARFAYLEDEKLYGLQIKTNGTEITQVTSLREFDITDIEDLKNLVFINSGSDYTSGYSIGYNDGLSAGKDSFSTEINTAYSSGYSEGEKTGYKKGYDVGLAKGQSDDPYDLGDFIFSIVDAPFYVIRNALNFEILGVNISSLVLFIITALVVVFVIKKVKGG